MAASSNIGMTEPGHTKFNLSYPLASSNFTTSGGDAGDSNSSNVVEDHDSVIPGILFGILVPHIVCTIFILARTFSRLFLLRKWFLDDTLIVLAWVFSTAVCVVYSIAAQSSFPDLSSTHFDANNPTALLDALRPYILRTYLALIFYQLCLCLTKLSILAFYFRIFASRRLEKRLAWATVIFVLLFGIPLLFMSIFQCHPVAGYFFGVPMKCFTFDPLLISSTSLHTATDAWLILLIIPCIVRLVDIPPRQKAALAVVLSLSIFVIAASLTRLQLSLRAGPTHYFPHANHHHNQRGEAGQKEKEDEDGVRVANTLAFFVMTILELDMALICASAPTLRPVLSRLWPRFLGGERRGRRGSDSESDEEGSVDLRSVVSYRGYPWTETGEENKNASVTNMYFGGAATGPPVPPPALFIGSHRTPTTLSLRSFMSSVTGVVPRSRGRVEAGATAGAGNRGDQAGFSGTGRWGDSQESFVLGMNDPNSPSRLTPV
ncbi:hypothetical protein QBC35DRAFT_554179, partial [Podospora australis]